MANIGALLAKNLKRLRELKGWTQQDLADKSGYSLQNIKRLETEENWVSAEGVSRIAEAFRCSQEELFVNPDLIVKPSIEEAMNVIQKALDRTAPTQFSVPEKLEDSQYQVTSGAPTQLSPQQKELLQILPTLDDRQIAGLLRHLEAHKKERDLETKRLQSQPEKRKKI